MNYARKRALYLAPALAAVGLLALLMNLAAGTGSPSMASPAGSIIKVPDDYGSIQAAIDAAADGDTILVADGHYWENLSITKGITLSGGWNISFSQRTPGDSTIDGQGLGRVISITCPSSDTVVTVDGFSLVSGNATGLGGAPAMLSAAGGRPSRGEMQAPDPLSLEEHLARLRAELAGAVAKRALPSGKGVLPGHAGPGRAAGCPVGGGSGPATGEPGHIPSGCGLRRWHLQLECQSPLAQLCHSGQRRQL